MSKQKSKKRLGIFLAIAMVFSLFEGIMFFSSKSVLAESNMKSITVFASNNPTLDVDSKVINNGDTYHIDKSGTYLYIHVIVNKVYNSEVDVDKCKIYVGSNDKGEELARKSVISYPDSSLVHAVFFQSIKEGENSGAPVNNTDGIKTFFAHIYNADGNYYEEKLSFKLSSTEDSTTTIGAPQIKGGVASTPTGASVAVSSTYKWIYSVRAVGASTGSGTSEEPKLYDFGVSQTLALNDIFKTVKQEGDLYAVAFKTDSAANDKIGYNVMSAAKHITLSMMQETPAPTAASTGTPAPTASGPATAIPVATSTPIPNVSFAPQTIYDASLSVTSAKADWRNKTVTLRYSADKPTTLYRSTSETDRSGAKPINELVASVSAETFDTTVSVGKKYYYWIQSQEGGVSNVKAVYINPAPVLKSLKVKKLKGTKTVEIRWVYDHMTKAVIYYKTPKVKKWKKLGSNKKKGNVTIGVQSSNQASFKIKAYYKYGSKKYYSSFSKVKTVKF